MTCGVYRIIHIASGRNYIGSAKDIERRFLEHLRQLEAGKHPNRHLQNAYSKYGRDAFRLEVAKDCDENERLTWEQIYISDAWDSGLLYNMNPVAGRGPTTPEAIARRLKTMAAKSPEEKAVWLKNLRTANLGKKRSPEAIRKFRKTIASRTPIEKAISAEKLRATKAAMNPDEKADIYKRVGTSYKAIWEAKPQEEKEAHQQAIREAWKKQTPEQRQARGKKISAKLTGKKKSQEAVEKNRAKSLGTKHSLETRQKMSESRTGKKMSQACIERRKATWAAKSPEEKAEILARAWATRRKKGK